MPDEPKKADQLLMVPRDLPMPRYEYQRPAGGSFTVRFRDSKDRAEEETSEKSPALANLNLAF